MQSIETGVQGSKVQSWAHANPRDLLKRLVEDNPGAGKQDLLKDLRQELLRDDGEEYLNAIIEYWFANNYYSLTHPLPRTPSKAKKRAISAKVKENIQASIRQQAILLLDSALPNGKTLKDTTFGECAEIGGALTLIAEKGSPDQVVGDVLSDDQLRELQAA